MNENIVLQLDYEQDEVVSAQRMRFLHSNRLKLLIALGILGMIVLIAQQIWFWFKEGTLPITWYTPIYLLLVFCGVFIIVYLFAPLIDFRLNPLWRNIFDLQLDDNTFRIIVAGKSQGIEKNWEKIKRVLENDKAYVLFFDSEEDFIILPKRVAESQEIFFQNKLNRKTSSS